MPRTYVRAHIRRFVASHPFSLGRPALVRFSADAIGDSDPWIAIGELTAEFTWDAAVRIVLDPRTLPPVHLDRLLERDDGFAADYCQRAAIAVVREHPIQAKETLLNRILGGRRYPALDLIPEVSPILNLTDANVVLASALPDALQPVDPYVAGPAAIAGRAVASVIANYPSLIQDLMAAAGPNPLSKAIAGDLIVLAIARDALLKVDQLPDFASVLAQTPDELAERVRPADNRYSTSDRFSSEEPRRSRRIPNNLVETRNRRSGTGFRVRLAVAVLVDVALFLWLFIVVRGLEQASIHVPVIGVGEALTATGLLIALHVLAVELASGAMPAGLVARVAWPVRLVSAYALATIAVVAALVPALLQELGSVAAIALLGHLPFVAKDLVAKSDLRRAVSRVVRDRSHDMVVAGELAGEAFQARGEVRTLLAKTPRIRIAATEPVTRRRVALHSRGRGYVSVDIPALSRVAEFLNASDESPLTTGRRPPSLVFLQEAGNEVAAGDLLAVVEVDEPAVARRAALLAGKAIKFKDRPAVDRSRDSIAALADVLNRQASSDRQGAQITSLRMQEMLTRFIDAGQRLAGASRPETYLGTVLPFDPELEAVRGFETLWVRAIQDQDETEQEALRLHALRLARLSQRRPFSAFADFLIVRLDVVARDTSIRAMHPCAALISDVAGLVCDSGRRESFFPARSALEGLLGHLSLLTPLPREEELIRQRFEELLARGLIADYFLETQVERACRKLLSLSTKGPSRQLRMHVGVAKVGAAALQSGRFALASRLGFLLREAAMNFDEARQLAASDAYRYRMSALSEMSGGLFGQDVAASLTRYLNWAERLVAVYPPPQTVSVR